MGGRSEPVRMIDRGERPDHDFDRIEHALTARPKISIRARVRVVFFILSLLVCLMTVAAVITLQGVMRKIVFFEKVEDYLEEVQQARRFEKNFFLYGTNLGEALTNVQLGREHLMQNAEDIQAVAGESRFRSVLHVLGRYEQQLNLLQAVSDGYEDRQGVEVKRIEADLRKYGAQIVSDAQEMIARERAAVHSTMQIAIILVVAFLIFMLLIMASLSGFIIRAVISPTKRFIAYAERIGSGDCSPITPARKYRDEFSDLAIAINRMLKEMRNREDQLIHSEKMAVVGKLTSGIAHELNNPLNNIGLSLESLIEGYDDYSDQDKRRILQQAYTQVERASGTVRNLLDFTRKEERALTKLEVADIVRSTLTLVENEMNLADVELELALGDTIPSIMGNPRGLQQVFLNLFLNAIQAMDGGGTLRVRTSEQDGFVRVDVSDTGPGIPAEMRDHIFEPFFTTKDPGRGTGLGLSVSLGIVEKHHGRISVESREGEGATLSVLIPCSPTAQAPAGKA